MPVFQARKLCPQLQFVPADHRLYNEYSHKFIELLKQYTHHIEVASIDEAYMDVTTLCESVHPLELANDIQRKLYETLSLPSSIGIASNKFLAKMASDFKKPMGITVLRRREVKDKLWPLKINEMYGIGQKTAPKLIEAGILTIGDLLLDNNKLKAIQILGNQFESFYKNALGFGDTHVDPSKNDTYKSIGNSLTYDEGILNEEIAYQRLKELTETVCNRLKKHRYLIKTISVQIKYGNFQSHSKSKTILEYTNDFDEIYNHVIQLFDVLWNKDEIRLLGVSTSNLILKEDHVEQLNLFTYEKYQDEEKVIKLIHQINRKYGKDSIKKGSKLNREK